MEETPSQSPTQCGMRAFQTRSSICQATTPPTHAGGRNGSGTWQARLGGNWQDSASGFTFLAILANRFHTQEEGPSRLPSIQALGPAEIGQVLVVSPHNEGLSCTLLQVAPLLESQHQGQELTVSHVVVPLCLGEAPAKESLPSWALRWESTAPTPVSEASTSTTNCRAGSG